MPFIHGSVARLYANGIDLTSYMKSATFSGEADTADVTTWGLTSKAYIPGKPDATISGEGVWDAEMQTNQNRPDDVFDAALAVAGVLTYLPAGDGVGKRARIIDMAETSYEVTSPGDDVTGFSFEAQSSGGGAGTGVVLKEATGTLGISAGGNGTNVDDETLAAPVATTFGAICALQVLQKGGGAGTLTVTIESSVNGSTGWATIASFTGVTAAKAKQVVYVAPGVTINRYLRAVWALTGGTWDINVAIGRRYQAGA